MEICYLHFTDVGLHINSNLNCNFEVMLLLILEDLVLDVRKYSGIFMTI